MDVEVAIAQYEYFLCKKMRHYEIEVRCCQLNDVENLEIGWPDVMTILVNDMVAL